jgi:MFS family permease
MGLRSVSNNPLSSHQPYAVWSIAGYRRFLGGVFVANFGSQMAQVAVGWQIYQWTHSAAALGLLGLVHVLPLLALALPSGWLADHLDRRILIFVSSFLTAIGYALLAGVSAFPALVPDHGLLHTANSWLAAFSGWFERGDGETDFSQPALPVVYLLLFLLAVVRIGGMSARSALVPLLVPAPNLSSAVTWNLSALEIARIAGPAISGFVIAGFGYSIVYAASALGSLLLALAMFGVHYENPPQRNTNPISWKDMLAGAGFIWKKKRILAASTLDLFAVLFGSVTVLLPLYADQILGVGPVGLGWLQAAPCVGSFCMAMWLAHRRPFENPGVALLICVAGFGAAVVLFGVSSFFWLSLLALALTGVFDSVSVIVRQSLVQLLTPDHLRGRVVSVNQVFIGSSNEVGALRAGLTAALIGPVAAVVWGGVGTLLVVLAVWRLFPGLKTTPALDRLKAD